MPFIKFRIHPKTKQLICSPSSSSDIPLHVSHLANKPPHHVFPKIFFLSLFPCPANKMQNITWLIVYDVQVTFLGSESNGLFKMQFSLLGIELSITQISYIPMLQEESNTTEN